LHVPELQPMLQLPVEQVCVKLALSSMSATQGPAAHFCVHVAPLQLIWHSPSPAQTTTQVEPCSHPALHVPVHVRVHVSPALHTQLLLPVHVRSPFLPPAAPVPPPEEGALLDEHAAGATNATPAITPAANRSAPLMAKSVSACGSPRRHIGPVAAADAAGAAAART
jgi:hypothetical protein